MFKYAIAMSVKAKAVLRLTIEQQERLIQLVQDNSLLYDVSSSDYSNKDMAVSTWAKIASELAVDGLDGEQCKNKWQNIEDYFHATRKMSKDTHKNGECKSNIKGQFYKRLHFLVQYTAEASVSGSEQPTSSKGKSTSAEINIENSDSDSDCIDDDDSFEQEVKTEIEAGPTQEEPFVWNSTGQEFERKSEKRRLHTSSPPVSPVTLHRNQSMKRKKKCREFREEKNVSIFYHMMSEKMVKFSESDQISMEDQIWKLYMQLVEKQKQENKN